MYKIDYKNLKKGYQFYGMFLVIGMIFLIIFGWFTFKGLIRRMSMDSEVKAYDVQVVTKRGSKGGSYYKPTYYYIVKGKKYSYTLPHYTNTAVSKIKTQNIIYYERSNPNNCVSEYEATIRGSNVFVILFILIFPAVGVKGIFDVKKRINKAKWLAQNGTLIKGLNYQLVETR